MPRNHDDRTRLQTGRGDRSRTRDGASPRSEALLVRSYDHQWAYDLDVEVVDSDGERLFEERYYLLPGHSESESQVAPEGEYEVRVTLDNSSRRTLTCRLDDTPEHTPVIEVGNGAFSITEGLA